MIINKSLVIALLSGTIVFSSCDTLNQVANQYGGVITNQLGTPTQAEMSSGLKEALQQGIGAGVNKLSAQNGFLGNAAIKIAFPQEAKKVESTLRSLGLNSLCDNVITSLNRAAEDAVKSATPIFVDAIKQMSFQDVTNILLGDKDAATQYFKRSTNAALVAKFSPIINSSINKVGATKYWKDVTTTYNKIPLVTPVSTDLTAYVTDKAVTSLFKEIATEELKIRQSTASRSTALLQKVFAYADTKK